jgi:hypothetical protein
MDVRIQIVVLRIVCLQQSTTPPNAMYRTAQVRSQGLQSNAEEQEQEDEEEQVQGEIGEEDEQLLLLFFFFFFFFLHWK